MTYLEVHHAGGVKRWPIELPVGTGRYCHEKREKVLKKYIRAYEENVKDNFEDSVAYIVHEAKFESYDAAEL